MAGEQIGRYQILEELGRGGQSVAYKALDPRIDRIVVIKRVRGLEELPPALKEEYLARFAREAQAAGRLSHPNIATVYDIDDKEGEPFIVMEFVEGRTLGQLIAQEHPLDPRRVTHLFGQICEALDYAHRNHIVHRDIKPGNILVTPDDRIKMVDFGIARLPSSQLTQTGALIGTPSYMSPEQIMGRPVDHRSDIFSLGVVLYECLAGSPPFSGENPTTIIFKIVSEAHPRLLDLNPQMAPHFDEILNRALAKEPDQRYQSCREMAADLQKLGGVPGEAPPLPSQPAQGAALADSEPTVLDLGEEVSEGPSRPASPAPSKTWLWRKRVPLSVAAVLLLGIGFFGLRSTPSGESESPATVLGGEQLEELARTGGEEMARRILRETEEALKAEGILKGESPPPPARGQSSPSGTPSGPSSSTPPRLSQAARARLLEEGRKAYREGRFREALQHLDPLTGGGSRVSEAYYLAGRSHFQQENYSRAASLLERAVQLAPETADYRVHLALSLEKLGRTEQAILHFEKVLEQGGSGEWNAPALRARIRHLKMEQELSKLPALKAPARHKHLVGDCRGNLQVDPKGVSFQADQATHSREGRWAAVRTFQWRDGELRLELSDGSRLNLTLPEPPAALADYGRILAKYRQ